MASISDEYMESEENSQLRIGISPNTTDQTEAYNDSNSSEETDEEEYSLHARMRVKKKKLI